MAALLALLAAAAPASALPYREVSNPDARRSIIVLHGGGWTAVGPSMVRGMRPVADRLADQGWRVVNTTYSPGEASAADVLAVYDRERRHHRRVAVLGGSAGAHLALIVAQRRHPCAVVAVAPPFDLTPTTGPLAPYLATWTHRRAYSPLLHPERFRGKRILIEAGEVDPLVPLADAERFAALTGACLLRMPDGPEPFVHQGSTADALAAAQAAQDRILSGMSVC